MTVRCCIALLVTGMTACVVGDTVPERPAAGLTAGSFVSQRRPDLNPPDLVISEDGLAELQFHWIDSIGDEMILAVENKGTATSRGFYVDFFQDLPAAPTFGMFSSRFSWIPGIPPGEGWVTQIVVPGITRWTGWFDALIDSDQFIPESDESNNVASTFSPCCYPHWPR